jgi:hypothetical protein
MKTYWWVDAGKWTRFTLQPLYHPRHSPGINCVGKWGPPVPFWTVRRKQNIIVLIGNRTAIPQSSSSCSSQCRMSGTLRRTPRSNAPFFCSPIIKRCRTAECSLPLPVVRSNPRGHRWPEGHWPSTSGLITCDSAVRETSVAVRRHSSGETRDVTSTGRLSIQTDRRRLALFLNCNADNFQWPKTRPTLHGLALKTFRFSGA